MRKVTEENERIHQSVWDPGKRTKLRVHQLLPRTATNEWRISHIKISQIHVQSILSIRSGQMERALLGSMCGIYWLPIVIEQQGWITAMNDLPRYYRSTACARTTAVPHALVLPQYRVSSQKYRTGAVVIPPSSAEHQNQNVKTTDGTLFWEQFSRAFRKFYGRWLLVFSSENKIRKSRI